MEQHSKGDKKKTTVTRPTVYNWENGKHVPPWGQLKWLTELFEKANERPGYGGPYDEERILFGKRRNDQIGTGRPYLVRVGDAEMALLTAFVSANAHGQQTMLESVQMLAKLNPAQDAEVVKIRR